MNTIDVLRKCNFTVGLKKETDWIFFLKLLEWKTDYDNAITYSVAGLSVYISVNTDFHVATSV